MNKASEKQVQYTPEPRECLIDGSDCGHWSCPIAPEQVEKFDQAFDSTFGLDELNEQVIEVERQYVRAAEREELWDAVASDPGEWSAAERAEYDALLDQEYDEYWSQHCVQHGSELQDGKCSICQQEEADERRNDL